MGVERNVYTIATLITIVGVLNWGAHAGGHNLIEKIGNKKVQNVLYGLVVVAALVSLYYFVDLKCYSDDEGYANPATKAPATQKVQVVLSSGTYNVTAKTSATVSRSSGPGVVRAR